jgi:hypothetical protein
MSARPRIVSEVQVVDVVDGACSLCRERARCAAPSGVDFRVCSSCAVSMAQLIAASRPSTARRMHGAPKRPHKWPCCCAECSAFDDGQRGELANPVLLTLEPAPAKSDPDGERPSATSDDAAPPRDSRFSWLEVY